MLKTLFASLCLVFLVSFASPFAKTQTAGPSPWELQEILHNNSVEAQKPLKKLDVAVDRAFAEYEDAGYLLISADFSLSSKAVKVELIKNLPEGVTAVVYAYDQQEARAAANVFAPLISPERLKVVVVGDIGVWARDSLPIPVLASTSDTGYALVDARYYHGQEPDTEVARQFHSPLLKHNFYYEGGNFISDMHGNCVAIAPRVKDMSDEFFARYYGCKTMHRLPHKGGIGHVDERVKFLSDDLVITDEPSYVSYFENLGYTVQLLPRAKGGSYRTHVNSLLLNGHIFMPSFGVSTDQEAKAIYEKLGYTVHLAPSNSLSDNGHGSIHCITMTYPHMDFSELRAAISGRAN